MSSGRARPVTGVTVPSRKFASVAIRVDRVPNSGEAVRPRGSWTSCMEAADGNDEFPGQRHGRRPEPARIDPTLGRAQERFMEMIASGAPLRSVLEAITEEV